VGLTKKNSKLNLRLRWEIYQSPTNIVSLIKPQAQLGDIPISNQHLFSVCHFYKKKKSEIFSSETTVPNVLTICWNDLCYIWEEKFQLFAMEKNYKFDEHSCTIRQRTMELTHHSSSVSKVSIRWKVLLPFNYFFAYIMKRINR
jgi:hypothetical protein